jgi:hypothetical protein
MQLKCRRDARTTTNCFAAILGKLKFPAHHQLNSTAVAQMPSLFSVCFVTIGSSANDARENYKKFTDCVRGNGRRTDDAEKQGIFTAMESDSAGVGVRLHIYCNSRQDTFNACLRISGIGIGAIETQAAINGVDFSIERKDLIVACIGEQVVSAWAAA